MNIFGKSNKCTPITCCACQQPPQAARVFLAKKGGSRQNTRVMLVFLTRESLRIYPSNKHDNTVHSPTIYCIGLVLTISVCRRISKVAQVGVVLPGVGSVVLWWWFDVRGATKGAHKLPPPLMLFSAFSASRLIGIVFVQYQQVLESIL